MFMLIEKNIFQAKSKINVELFAREYIYGYHLTCKIIQLNAA